MEICAKVPNYFGKFPFWYKWSKMAQQWGFGLFRKIYSAVLSGNRVE